MSEKRTAANRRNAKMSTGPTSDRGKQRSARNAHRHGLSISTDSASEEVKALAALLSPTATSDRIDALALEAARRIMDSNRVRTAHQALYARLGNEPIMIPFPTQPSTEFSELGELAASLFKLLQPPTAPPFTIIDLAKQLDKLARYERRALSLRERALTEWAGAIDRERLRSGT
jgi:hypothetical protein